MPIQEINSFSANILARGIIRRSDFSNSSGFPIVPVFQSFHTVRKIPFMYCISLLGIARLQSKFPHSLVCERFIYSQERSTCFPAAKQADRSWKYTNLSQIYACRNWETDSTHLFSFYDDICTGLLFSFISPDCERNGS